ncbi:hypothetical protein AB0K71_22305 [Streptomyces syringium]|uniref:hypothetical protein n=1 Tax=Streptomyces syringium TaxID=76729 RepID=UPI0033C5D03E
MESAPAGFAGTAFTLFGGALLLWTGARAVLGAPVVEGASPRGAVALSLLFGAGTLATGLWLLLGL